MSWEDHLQLEVRRLNNVVKHLENVKSRLAVFIFVETIIIVILLIVCSRK